MNSVFNYINEMNQLWFQYIPSDWRIKNLGHLSKMIVPMRDKPTSFDGTIPWVRIEDFDGKYISDSKSKQYVSKELIKEMNLKVFPKGTVMCTCSCNMGVTAIVDKPLISNQTFIGIVPREELDSEYLYFLMQASADRLQMFSQGAIQQYLSRHDFEHIKIPLPTISDQKRIVNFLNDKLKNLDGLIQNKKNLVKLLEEKRQSLITETVTKGLNANVEMKDSGVEWIGEIPEHWIVKPLYTIYKENKTKNKDNLINNVLSLSYGKVKRRDVESNYGLLPDSFETYQIVEKDYLVLRLTDLQNDKRSLRVGLVNEKGIITSAYVGLKTSLLLNSKYAYYLLHSYDLAKVFYGLGSGVRQSLGYAELKKLPMLIPNLKEQHEIVVYLDNMNTQNGNIIDDLKKQLQKLKEYRQSLIYEAVTGKIDVRDFELSEK